MRITITVINFKYDNGYDEDYTHVDLRFMQRGFSFRHNESVMLTKEEYEPIKSDENEKRKAIVDRLLDDVDEYKKQLEEYKESLNAE